MLSSVVWGCFLHQESRLITITIILIIIIRLLAGLGRQGPSCSQGCPVCLDFELGVWESGFVCLGLVISCLVSPPNPSYARLSLTVLVVSEIDGETLKCESQTLSSKPSAALSFYPYPSTVKCGRSFRPLRLAPIPYRSLINPL